MATYAPICLLCEHFGDHGTTCRAFPDGIPTPILHASSLHLRPYPGDHGTTFRLRPDDRTREAARRMVATGQLPPDVLTR